MSRIAIPDITSATGPIADIYARVKKISGGRVPNTYAALGYLVPAVFGCGARRPKHIELGQPEPANCERHQAVGR